MKPPIYLGAALEVEVIRLVFHIPLLGSFACPPISIPLDTGFTMVSANGWTCYVRH